MPPQLRRKIQDVANDPSSDDPYQHLVLKVLGRLDVAHKMVRDVVTTSEDYLWLQVTHGVHRDAVGRQSLTRRAVSPTQRTNGAPTHGGTL